MRPLVVFFALSLFMSACTDDAANKGGEVVEEIRGGDGIKASDIIRNPVTADEPTDSINVARMKFDDEWHKFGTVDAGTTIKHTFHFTNVGKVPLLIANARSTCGCTVPKWPEEPIPPGEKGEIYVEFNTTGKKSYQDKPITISANTYPAATVLHMKGFVTPEGENDKSKTEK